MPGCISATQDTNKGDITGGCEEVPAAEPDCSDAQHKGRTPKSSPRTQESKLLATCLFHNPRNKCGKLVVCVYVHAFGVVVFVWGVCMFAIVCVLGAIPQEPFT